MTPESIRNMDIAVWFSSGAASAVAAWSTVRAKPAPEVPETVTLWGSIDENGVVIGAFTKHHNTHLSTHTITGTIVPINEE